MQYNRETAKVILQTVEGCLKEDEAPEAKLKNLWHILMYMRSLTLLREVRGIVGNKVFSGPFKNMILTEDALIFYKSPMLLGGYEHELHAVCEKIISKNYARILNIGCSVGYYAVGFARRMPDAIIKAFDIDPVAQKKCADLAQANDVQNQVHISGEFNGGEFAAFANEKTLVLMDIEGAETTLLDPVKFPALKNMDVIVELHDCVDQAISKTICDRFAATHKIELVQNQNYMPDVNGFLQSGQNLDSFDQFLLGWEGRAGSTPWGIFWAKNK